MLCFITLLSVMHERRQRSLQVISVYRERIFIERQDFISEDRKPVKCNRQSPVLKSQRAQVSQTLGNFHLNSANVK